MIIYQDLISGDEIISDVYAVKDAGNGLFEVDGKMVKPGSENFVLEGANPSAEGEDADDGGDGGDDSSPVLDLAQSFRWQKIEGISKKVYQADLKIYMKALVVKMKAAGKAEADIKEFQTGAAAAAKTILGNWDNYDVYKPESMDEGSMYILVDFREDGMTPYATIWKHGLKEEKV